MTASGQATDGRKDAIFHEHEFPPEGCIWNGNDERSGGRYPLRAAALGEAWADDGVPIREDCFLGCFPVEVVTLNERLDDTVQTLCAAVAQESTWAGNISESSNLAFFECIEVAHFGDGDQRA